MRKRMCKRKGFTMVELMVVVIIMAILGLAVMPSLIGSSEKANTLGLTANRMRLRHTWSQTPRTTAGAEPFLQTKIYFNPFWDPA